MSIARLRGVRILVEDLPRAISVYQIITGVTARMQNLENQIEAWLLFGNTYLRLAANAAGPATATAKRRASAISGIDIEVADPSASFARLAPSGLAVRRDGPGGWVDIAGLRIHVASFSEVENHSDGDVSLDHLAVLVPELEAPTHLLELLTGLHAHRMGHHPISKGTFSANRLMMSDQMLELVAPEPGAPSSVASRLALVGEGPSGLALPARQLDTKLAQLKAAGIEPLFNSPHWLIRPSQAYGVSVQLTPRVNH